MAYAETLVVEPEHDYRTIDGLKKHPLYQLLTARQQTFLIHFIESNGDRLFAARKCMKSGTDDSAQRAAVRMLRTVYVRKLIALYFGYDVEQAPMSRTEFNGLIASRLRKPELRDLVFVRLAELLVESKHWNRKRDERREESLGKVIPKDGDSKPPVEYDELTIDDLVRKIEEGKRGTHKF